MELFDSVYSFWALALVLLCAGNGLFFLTCSTYPKWPWKSISVPVSAQKKSKRRKKKDSTKVQVFKDKEGPWRENVRKSTERLNEVGGLTSDVEYTTSKHEASVTTSGSESPASSNPLKGNKKEIARLKGEHVETPKLPQEKRASDLIERRASVEDDHKQENRTQAVEGKKHRKKKTKKPVPSVSNGTIKSADSEEQRSDQESGEGWFLVSSGGKAKVSRGASSKHAIATPSDDVDDPNKPDKRGLARKIPISIDRKPAEISSLVDVFDLSMAELKEKESRYHEEVEAADPSLQKIISARIVDIQQNNESNGFAASAAVASVHHLKQTLMSDGRTARNTIESSQSNQSGHHEQLAYEHQIRTSEIQREFMKSTGSLGSAVAAWPKMDPVGRHMQVPPTERFSFLSAGRSSSMASQSGWTGEAARSKYNYGQTLQSSFEFVGQRNMSLVDNEQLTSIECDEGSIAFRHRDNTEFEERQFDRVESRISDTTEEEYSVIDTIMSSEFSRQNNSSGSIVDAVEESMHHDFGYDDDRAVPANDESFDDIDLIDEYSMVALTPTCTKHSTVPADRTIPARDKSSINSSLTFHGRERLMVGKPSQHHVEVAPQANVDQQVEKPVGVEIPSGSFSSLRPPSPPIGTPISALFRRPWVPASLVFSSADQIRNGFPTYRTHRQYVMLEAMRAVQAAFDVAAAQKKPPTMPRQAPYISGRQVIRHPQMMRGAT